LSGWVAGDEVGERGVVFPFRGTEVPKKVGVVFCVAKVRSVFKRLLLNGLSEDGEHGLEGGLGFASGFEELVERVFGDFENTFLIEQNTRDGARSPGANRFPENIQPAGNRSSDHER